MAYSGLDFDSYRSYYGRDPLSLVVKIPDLKVGGADTAIHLSEAAQDILLVPSEVLKASNWFKAGLSERWASSAITDSSTSTIAEGIRYSYGLKRDTDDDGYSLFRSQAPDPDPIPASDEFWIIADTRQTRADFYRSAASPSYGTIPAYADAKPIVFLEDHRKHAIRDHRIMLALLLGVDVDLEVKDWMEWATCLANVVAYAQYYDLLPRLAPSIKQLFYRQPGIWEDIASSSEFYLALGDILRSEAIFGDALRHFLGNPERLGGFAQAALDFYSFETQLVIHKKSLELGFLNQEIEDALRQLTFQDRYFAFLDTRYDPQKSERDKAIFLARAILAEYLNIQFTTKRGSYHRVMTHNVTHNVYQSILVHAKHDLSARLFRTQTPQQLTSIFHLGRDRNSGASPQRIIREELKRLLDRAAQVISSRTLDEDAPRAARFSSGRYLTNLDMRKDEHPWAREVQRDQSVEEED